MASWDPCCVAPKWTIILTPEPERVFVTCKWRESASVLTLVCGKSSSGARCGNEMGPSAVMHRVTNKLASETVFQQGHADYYAHQLHES